MRLMPAIPLNQWTGDSVLKISGPVDGRAAEVLSQEALTFLEELHDRFDARRLALLEARMARQAEFDKGALPDFPEETRDIREGDWKVAPIPADLQDRRVEITGPVDRKMIINALNSGAKVFMADFEDASSPTWANMIEGQVNFIDLWHGELAFTDPKSGKQYAVNKDRAVLKIRPRGWHLPEAHVTKDGKPVSGSLFDFGLYMFHTAQATLDAGSGPYFYLPKLESRHEAALWNDVIDYTEERLGLAPGVTKVTVLIETIPAAFEMDEILHALKTHIVGLNCGRWDYIFSTIKRLGRNPDFLTPDRAVMGMGSDFLAAYSKRLIQVCHRRGAHAMGGMAAQIPVKGDDAANEAAYAKVRADKEREAGWGHDGTWVAHPAMVSTAMEVFDRLMPAPNQHGKSPADTLSQADLLQMHSGARTEAGLRENIRVGVQYIEAWLMGRGAVPLYNLMEDAATAEISRTQIWQWLRFGAALDDGRKVDAALVLSLLDDEMGKLRAAGGERPHLDPAIEIFRDMSLADDCAEFLTLPAYEWIVANGG